MTAKAFSEARHAGARTCLVKVGCKALGYQMMLAATIKIVVAIKPTSIAVAAVL